MMTGSGHEINLMPREVIEGRLRRLYLTRVRRVLNTLYPLLVLLLVAEIIIYFSLISIRDSVIYSEENGFKNGQDAIGSVEQINELLLEVQKRSSVRDAWTPQLQELLSVLPDEMKISTIDVEKKDDSLTIRGEYSLGSAVVAFQKEIEVLPWVEKVESPLQNFALDPKAGFLFSVYRKGLKDND